VGPAVIIGKVSTRWRNKEMGAEETDAVISRDFGPPCALPEFAGGVALLGPDPSRDGGTL